MFNIKMNEAVVATLREIILAKTDRVESLERMADEIRATYGNMNNDQLEKAYQNTREMEREIEKHKAWIKEAKAQINRFYRPAFCAA